MGIDDIGPTDVGEQRADGMRVVGSKRHDLAATQEPAQLDLAQTYGSPERRQAR